MSDPNRNPKSSEYADVNDTLASNSNSFDYDSMPFASNAGLSSIGGFSVSPAPRPMRAPTYSASPTPSNRVGRTTSTASPNALVLDLSMPVINRDDRASTGFAMLERDPSSVVIASNDSDDEAPNGFMISKTPEQGQELGDVMRYDHHATFGTKTRKPTSYLPVWQRYCFEYRLIEFGTVALMGVASLVCLAFPVYRQPIPNIKFVLSESEIAFGRDPTINRRTMEEHFTTMQVAIISTLPAIMVNLMYNYFLPIFLDTRVIAHDVRDFLLSLSLSIGISQLLTQFLKSTTGRLRPCFYHMCQWDYTKTWDGTTDLCRSVEWEKEARKSFPSGHSSFAIASLGLLTLYLMGRSRLVCTNRSIVPKRGAMKSLSLFLCFLPTLFACWIGITRTIDNWHDYTDILAGSLVGLLSAVFGYRYNYGSVFDWESAGLTVQAFHERRTHGKNRTKSSNGTALTTAMSQDIDERGSLPRYSQPL